MQKMKGQEETDGIHMNNARVETSLELVISDLLAPLLPCHALLLELWDKGELTA